MTLKELLESNGIEVSDRGHKHFKEGWTHLCCPFCGDGGFHLGFPDGGTAGRCFKCGKQRLTETLELVLKWPRWRAIEASKSIAGSPHPVSFLKREEESGPSEEVKWPVGAKEWAGFHPNHVNYLRNRNFEPEKIVWDRDLRAIGAVGERPWTIVIPIYDQGRRMVSWQARDITGASSTRYYTHAQSAIKRNLYGLHMAAVDQKKIIVVEGVTDAWRFSPGKAVATFGQDWSQDQFRLLLKFDEILVLFDSEVVAQHNGKKLADSLSVMGRWSEAHALTEFFEGLEGKDPGDLDQDLADQLEEDFYTDLQCSGQTE